MGIWRSSIHCTYKHKWTDIRYILIKKVKDYGKMVSEARPLSLNLDIGLTQSIFYGFRSNKGASKQRRDQINSEIGTMRDLLPLPESARQRLSQLQIMSLSCVYIRKCNILQKSKLTTFRRTDFRVSVSKCYTTCRLFVLIILTTGLETLQIS